MIDMESYNCDIADDLVCIKTIADGSCLFHSILTSYSTRYLRLTDDEKKEKVKNVRKNFSTQLTKDEWMSIGHGEASKHAFFTSLRDIIEHIYSFFSGEDNILEEEIKNEIEKNRRVFEFIFKRIGKETLQDKIIQDTSKTRGDVYFSASSFCNLVKKHLKKTYMKRLNEADESKFLIILETSIDFFQFLTQSCINKCFISFKKKLEDPEEWMDFEYIPLISDLFDVNIYFIDDVTKQPYITGKDKFLYDAGRKCIILIWQNQCHFNVLGVMDNNGAKTTFDIEDPIIQKIHNYATNNNNKINNN